MTCLYPGLTNIETLDKTTTTKRLHPQQWSPESFLSEAQGYKIRTWTRFGRVARGFRRNNPATICTKSHSTFLLPWQAISHQSEEWKTFLKSVPQVMLVQASWPLHSTISRFTTHLCNLATSVCGTPCAGQTSWMGMWKLWYMLLYFLDIVGLK